MAGRAVRSRSRVLLSDSSSDDDSSDNVDIVVKHVVAEGRAAAAPSLLAPPGVGSMLLDDDLEDDHDISLEENEPPVTIFALAEPSTPPVRSFPQENYDRNMNTNSNINMEGGGNNPLHQLLWRRGIHVHPEWLASCVREMEGSNPGFSNFGVDRQGELVFAHLLVTDFNEVGAGCLPPSFENLHATELAGPFVLQVDEISDIGAPLRERYHERAPNAGRCLKLSMTDGVQRVVGIEYQPIAALHNLFPAGLKICLRNVFVRRGVFLLSCESVEVLGGFVQLLEEARQRAVHEVNKPARGSRHRRGQTGDRSLAERATAEAWSRNIDGASPLAAAPIPQGNPNGQPVQPLQPTAASIFQSFVGQGPVQPARSFQGPQVPDADADMEQSVPSSHTETRFNATVQQATSAASPTHTETRLNETRYNATVQQATPAVGLGRTETRLNETRFNSTVQQATSVASPTHTETRLNETRFNATVQQATPAVGATVQNLEVKRRQTTLPWVQTSVNDAVLIQSQESSPKRPAHTLGSYGTQQRVTEQTTTRDSSAQRPVVDVQTPWNLDSDDDDFESVPAPSQRHQTPVSSDEPFTYLALLKERLSAETGFDVAVGKIKCVLTGVKDFKFKDCEEFTLIVHVDDGSLVTEALIHHEVVQKMVGFSPKEVNSALASKSSQVVREMKSNMKRFQAFLKKFEGLTYVQYKLSSAIPIISHMEEGVPDGDLIALQKRVGNDTSVRRPGVRSKPEFIDVSP